MKKIITTLALVAAATSAMGFNYPSHTSYISSYVVNSKGNQEYQFNMDQDIKILNELQEKLHGVHVGYYAMSAFTFQAGIGGYMGLQQDYMGKKLIFSTWDPPASTGLEVSTNHTNCRRFGHEGTGVMCVLKFNWKAGVEYRLSLNKIETTSFGEKYQAKLITLGTQEEFVIGEIETPTYNPGLQNNGPAFVGYGGISPVITNTLEYYWGPQNMTCSTLPYFGVEWKGPYGDNNTRFIRESVASTKTNVGENCESNVRATATNEPYGFIQEAGGNLQSNIDGYRYIIQYYTATKYNEIDCLLNRAEFLYSDLFNQKKFKQIQVSKTVGNLYGRDYRDRGTNNGAQLYADMNTNTLQYVENGKSWTVAPINDSTKNLHGCKY